MGNAGWNSVGNLRFLIRCARCGATIGWCVASTAALGRALLLTLGGRQPTLAADAEPCSLVAEPLPAAPLKLAPSSTWPIAMRPARSSRMRSCALVAPALLPLRVLRSAELGAATAAAWLADSRRAGVGIAPAPDARAGAGVRMGLKPAFPAAAATRGSAEVDTEPVLPRATTRFVGRAAICKRLRRRRP
jgi:hypothetical protein